MQAVLSLFMASECLYHPSLALSGNERFLRDPDDFNFFVVRNVFAEPTHTLCLARKILAVLPPEGPSLWSIEIFLRLAILSRTHASPYVAAAEVSTAPAVAFPNLVIDTTVNAAFVSRHWIDAAVARSSPLASSPSPALSPRPRSKSEEEYFEYE
jgi:hypothetical protein